VLLYVRGPLTVCPLADNRGHGNGNFAHGIVVLLLCLRINVPDVRLGPLRQASCVVDLVPGRLMCLLPVMAETGLNLQQGRGA